MTPTEDDLTYENTVILRGVLAAEPLTRIMPSGDELCSFRLTVRRPPDAARSRTAVDSIDCAATNAGVRRTAGRALPGEVLELTGRLQRRFWRGAAGVNSRYEVEVLSLKRQPAAARRRAGQKNVG